MICKQVSIIRSLDGINTSNGGKMRVIVEFPDELVLRMFIVLVATLLWTGFCTLNV
jgi:hypothetical protein